MCHGCTALSREVVALVSERDAARAEVARLNEQYEATANVYLDEQDRANAFRDEAVALRERLDGLRAKVQSLRDSHVCDLGVRHCHEGPAFDAVLAIFDKFEGDQ